VAELKAHVEPCQRQPAHRLLDVIELGALAAQELRLAGVL